jgi:hypothetical protein
LLTCLWFGYIRKLETATHPDFKELRPEERPMRSLMADWFDSYRADNAELVASDPEFTRWLEEEYAPIAGGWQY